MPDGIHFRTLRSTAELQAFLSQWDELWRSDNNATPFQSPAWLLPWWRSFGQQLRALAVSRNGTLLALLPFYIYRQPGEESQLLPVGVGTTDYLDGIFSPACTIRDVTAALEFLRDSDGWNTLCASQLRPQSLLARAFEELPDTDRFDSEGCSQMPAVQISDLPYKIRRNVKNYCNRASRLGDLQLERVIDDWRAPFEALLRLHTARWQSEGEPGVFRDERVVNWHREALPMLHERGLLRFSLLKLNGQIIAVLYSLVDPPSRPARTEYFYLSAYAPEFAELSPGTLSFALTAERAAQEGVQKIDLLRGEEPYKQFWHPARVPTMGFSLRRSITRDAQPVSGSAAGHEGSPENALTRV